MKKQPVKKESSFFDNRNRMLAIVIGISVVLRVIILNQWNASVFHFAVWSDASTYNQWARKIITTGDWIGTDPFLMTPFYPYFLAVIYSITGESLTAIRLIQNGISIGTILLIFYSAEKLFNKRTAFFAALIASLYGPFYLHANLLLVETTKVFLLILSFYLLLRAKEKNEMRWWIYSGLTLGAGILCRPTELLTVGVALLWMLFFLSKNSYSRVRTSIALVAAVLIVVLPVTIRNYSVSKELIPVTSNGGLNFYLGNNPKAVGVYYNVDGLDLANDPDGRVYLESLTGKQFTAGESSAYWTKEALAYIAEQPLNFFGLMAQKTLLFFHYKEIGQLGYNYKFISEHAVPMIGYLITFIILFPLSVVGMIALQKECRNHFLLYGFLAAQILSVILFFVTDRFRLSSIPLFILFAAYGIDWLIEQWNVRDRKRLMIALISMVTAVSFASFLNIQIVDEYSAEHEYIGMNFFDMKQYDKALSEYQLAVRYKESFHIHNNIGNVYAAVGNLPEAMKEYRRGESLNPRQTISVFSMGTAYVRAQQFDSALIYFERSKRINPRFAPAYLNAGLSYWYKENYTAALANLEQYIAMERDKEKTVSVLRDIENLKQIIAAERK